ncbi:hypothetical protein, partial [Bacillus salipaludis]|uniref:hypothetical protein n=1 Tax=Bacillus salipaludis TaxID=2547811 RepID=UPI002E23A070|nr:hypothetical protein [Bacillus salipaludis]
GMTPEVSEPQIWLQDCEKLYLNYRVQELKKSNAYFDMLPLKWTDKETKICRYFRGIFYVKEK